MKAVNFGTWELSTEHAAGIARNGSRAWHKQTVADILKRKGAA